MHVTLVNTSHKAYIPLALYYLKAYADADPQLAAHCSIEVLDDPVAPTDGRAELQAFQSLYRSLIARRPDVVGFSCYVWNITPTLALCRALKKQLPTTQIVLGGPEVSPLAQRTLRENPCIDIIVCGEGEETFRDLLHTLLTHRNDRAALQHVAGLAVRHNDNDEIETILQTPPRPILDNLDVIPSPYLNGRIDLSREKRTILFETYRGCPFPCSFCYYPKDFGKLIHSFSFERVQADLQAILASGVTDLLLMDPTFNVPPKRAKQILQFIANSPRSPDLHISTELRVDLLDAEMIDLLNAAGVHTVEIGLQSANPDVLRGIDRKQSLAKITHNAKQMQTRQMHLVCQLIYGLPQESFASFLDSLDYAVSLNVDKIEAYRLQLLPGTPLYVNAAQLGLEFFDTPPREVQSTTAMSAREITHARELVRMIELVYNQGVARTTFCWLADFLEQSFACVVWLYVQWRERNAHRSLVSVKDLTRLWQTASQATPRLPFRDWLQQSTLSLADFLHYTLDELDELDRLTEKQEEMSQLTRVTHDLLHYDYCLHSHSRSSGMDADTLKAEVLAWEAVHIARFDTSIRWLLHEKPTAGHLPAQQETWLVFWPDQQGQAHRSAFNGTFTSGTACVQVTPYMAACLRAAQQESAPSTNVLHNPYFQRVLGSRLQKQAFPHLPTDQTHVAAV